MFYLYLKNRPIPCYIIFIMPDQIQGLKKRVKPELPGGFRDYAPREARLKQWILDTARRIFEQFGFEPIETSAAQKTEILTGGEADSQKIIFNIRGSQDSASDGESDTSLRFDLTVPLARFIAANPDIAKPFKRYEIGRVWRGERQQAGRYREFTQADADIVGADSPAADAEIIAVIYTTLKNLGIEKFVIRINDRKELETLPAFAGFSTEKLWAALRIIDKKDKIGASGVADELREEFGSTATGKITTFLAAPPETTGTLAAIATMLDAMGIGKKYWSQDRSLVRGLSYYTGPVFETVLTEAPEIGSVFGGGRYDDLVMSFTGQKIPAVGVSLGVDRLIAALEQLGKTENNTALPPQVLILNLIPDATTAYLTMAQELRDVGVNCSLYLGDDTSFQAQLAYALKKETAYIIICGEEEKKKGVIAIKNLQTREQKEIPRGNLKIYFQNIALPS